MTVEYDWTCLFLEIIFIFDSWWWLWFGFIPGSTWELWWVAPLVLWSFWQSLLFRPMVSIKSPSDRKFCLFLVIGLFLSFSIKTSVIHVSTNRLLTFLAPYLDCSWQCSIILSSFCFEFAAVHYEQLELFFYIFIN